MEQNTGKGFVAKASIYLNAPASAVWKALTTPALIKRYFFESEVVSDWKEGAPIVWKGVWNGKVYEDKGVILKTEPERLLQYSHFSPLAGLPDAHENYHVLNFELSKQGQGTQLNFSQDNNSTEKDREHSQKMWESMLVKLKEVVEKSP